MTSTYLTTLNGQPLIGGSNEQVPSANLYRHIANDGETSIDGPIHAQQLFTVVARPVLAANVRYVAVGNSKTLASNGELEKIPHSLPASCVFFKLPARLGTATTLALLKRRSGSSFSRVRQQSLPPYQLRHPESDITKGRVTAALQPSTGRASGEKMILYVASMVDERNSTIIHAFAASMATSETEFRYRLAGRAGARTASTATVSSEFDPSEPIAAYLLPDSIAEILVDVMDDPTSILANGLDVYVEHRFAMERSASAPFCRFQ